MGNHTEERSGSFKWNRVKRATFVIHDCDMYRGLACAIEMNNLADLQQGQVADPNDFDDTFFEVSDQMQMIQGVEPDVGRRC